jgi:RND family efflux transporter MFP subunit
MALPGRALVISITVVVLVIAATGSMVKIRNDAKKADSANAKAASSATPTAALGNDDAFGGSGPQPVYGALVVKDTLVISVNATGQAAAWQQIPLSVEVAGRIARLPYRENDPVAAGSVLLSLDTTEFAFNLASANTRLKQAQANYRAEILTDYRITDPALRASRDTAARMKSGLAEAEIQLQRAQMDYERVRLRAPFSGRVANIKAVPGQRVAPGAEVLTIIDIDPIKVEVQVLESQIGFLARGRKAQITFAAFPDEVFNGQIETTNPIVDQTTRMARVTVTIPNPRGRILPGMYARVKLDATRLADRILVPRTAILQRGRDLVMVYRPEGDHGVAEWRYVTIGQGNDDFVEIVDNPDTKMVAPGEIVLTNGHYTIAHDAPVKLVNKPDGGGSK